MSDRDAEPKVADTEGRRPTGPLSGVRVVDLTAVVIGPYCTELLGDMGADVIKVEPPEGDITRWIGPRRSEGMSAQFLSFNRNKRSIVLDLKQPAGHAALLRLVETADVFVCNMRPQALARLNITYSEIAAVKPEIVYCRIVGFGAEHPRRNRPAIDDIIQAMSGVMSLQEHLTGTPSFVGFTLADSTGGLFALSGILAALYRKATTGHGDEVELPMYDAMASFVLTTHLSGSVFEPPLGPPVYPRSVAPNRRPFKTQDGSLVISPYSDREWRRFLAVIGREDLMEDERYGTTYARSHNLDELYGIVGTVIAERPTSEWVSLFEEADVPHAPVQSTADVLADPTLRTSGMLTVAEHETEGTLQILGNPVRFTQAPCDLHELPDVLGASAREILLEAGFTPSAIDQLVASGATIIPGETGVVTTDAVGPEPG
jgi:crotonobetainyl-CoA:carnitine CoA-transferase CaiB-like acyl-CoA transferase